MNFVFSFVVAFVLAIPIAIFVIPILRKLKFGQTILEGGPSHQQKNGTPTMGGVIFIASATITTLAFAHEKWSLIITLTGILFGAIGFFDDYIKVVKKRNMGFSASQKFLAQFIVSTALAVYMYFALETRKIIIPFYDNPINLGVFFIPFVIFVMLATVNSVNLTDGLDGLASSISIIVILLFIIFSNILKMPFVASTLASVAGGVLGFLLFNFYPAKVFMGDTGSLYLGGILSAVSIVTGTEIFLIISGFVFVMETLSVIIQVTSYKTRKKRVFKMAPIHHHFEKCGWHETKVVLVFSLITLLLCAISYFGFGGGI